MMSQDSDVDGEVTWLSQTWLALNRACKRFPLSLLCLTVLIAHILLNGQSLLTYAPGFEWQSVLAPYFEVPFQFRQYFWLLSIGFCWFTVVSLATEARDWSFANRYALPVLVYAAYAWYLIWGGISNAACISAQTLCLGLAISISFAPWLLRSSNNAAFQSFGYFCLSRLIKICLFAVVGFFVFFFLDLMTRNFVFGIFQILRWVALCWLFWFAPLQFLAGIPRQTTDEKATDDLFSLKEFKRYSVVALSFVGIIFLFHVGMSQLLYREATSIEWILLTLILGILLHITLYRSRLTTNEKESWLYRYLYLFLLIPVVYLAYKFKIRIEHFGLTELRYFGLILCTWVLLTIGWFYFGKQPFQLQTVPKLLATLCVLASFGFWQIGKLPNALQLDELEQILIKEKLLSAGVYTPPTINNQPSLDVRKKIKNKIPYLATADNKEKFRTWFKDKKAFDEAVTCGDQPNNCDLQNYESSLLVLMQLITKDLTTFEFPTSSDEYAPFYITSPYKDESLKPDLQGNAGYTDLEGFIASSEYTFYNTKGYDYVFQYNNVNLGADTVVDTVFDIMLNLEANEKERIRTTFYPTGQFDLSVGKASKKFAELDYQKLENNKDPDEYLRKHEEIMEKYNNEGRRLMRDSPFDGTAKKITVNLQTFLNEILVKYHNELKIEDRVYNQLPTELKLEKNNVNPLRIEKTENGLKLKIEMSELCIKAKVNSNEKKPCGFSGMIYIKLLGS